MKPRICVCCGEPISEKGNALSRNPNMCASCSSLADGIEETDTPEPPRPEQERPLITEPPVETRKVA
jgi:hypothetical protein